jgi:hypothetical protein
MSWVDSNEQLQWATIEQMKAKSKSANNHAEISGNVYSETPIE